MVAAYSYMALVPIIQPPVIKAADHEEGTADPYALQARQESPRLTRILFPIIITVMAGIVAPSVGLAGRLPDVRQPASASAGC